MKINPVLLYSTLNPLINSLSPSAKSNGARFVSEIQQIHQGIIIKIDMFNLLKERKLEKENLENKTRGENKIKIKTISYLTL